MLLLFSLSLSSLALSTIDLNQYYCTQKTIPMNNCYFRCSIFTLTSSTRYLYISCIGSSLHSDSAHYSIKNTPLNNSVSTCRRELGLPLLLRLDHELFTVSFVFVCCLLGRCLGSILISNLHWSSVTDHRSSRTHHWPSRTHHRSPSCYHSRQCFVLRVLMLFRSSMQTRGSPHVCRQHMYQQVM